MHVLSEVPHSLDRDALLKRLHIEPGTDDARAFGQLVDQALQVASPKAVCKEAYVDDRTDETVTLDGVVFTSRALSANLEGVHRVFAFVATCGRELDAIGVDPDDFVKQFWLDGIKATMLSTALQHLNAHLDKTYALGKTSSMSPGSGDVTVWPIEQQRPLFSLFGNVEDLIGVTLTDSFLMIPNKSLSGIRFPTEVDFRTCQLCRRERCPSRGAPFDPDLWESIQHGEGT